METLDFILKRYNFTLTEGQFIAPVGRSRWHEMPELFKDLGFKKGVEVGVFKGSFSLALCKPNPDLHLIGVDSWMAYEGYNEFTAEELNDDVFLEAKTRTEGFNISFIKATSMNAVKRFADESLDFVFIDANHDYEHTVEDIAVWNKKVRKGGLVCGHGYVKNEKYDFGVIDAVNGWCNSYGIKPLFLWKDKLPSWMYVK